MTDTGMAITATVTTFAQAALRASAGLDVEATVTPSGLITTEQVRAGASFYPWPEAGAPEVPIDIESGLTRKGAALYAFPATDVEQDDTLESLLVYTTPA